MLSTLDDACQHSALSCAFGGLFREANILQIAALVLTSLICRSVYSLYFHPLAAYPGPWLARSGLPFSWTQAQGIKRNTLWSLDAVHKKYGTWVRIGYNEISTLDGAAIPVLYGTSTRWRKSGFYSVFRSPTLGDNLFSATDPHVHSTLRRMSASAYTMTSLLRLESGVQRQVVSLLTSLTSRYADVPDKHCDIGRMLQFLAADVVGALAFGHEDGFDMVNDDKDDKGWLDAVQGTNEVGFILGSWHTWGPRLWNLLGIIGTPPKAITQLFQMAESNCAKRRQALGALKSEGHDVSEEGDMMSSFSSAKDPSTGKQLTNQQVAEASMAVLVAGSDTTSTTMRAFLMYLLTTPGVLDKLMTELDEAFDSGSLSWPPRYSEATRLPYFQACLKESLRMWPAVAWVMSRKAPPGGATIGDRTFPEGTMVGISAHHYHRNTDAFGPTPDVFRPERWLDLSDSDRKSMEANFLSFGVGTRICIGRNISLLEMSIALPTLLRRFSFELVQQPQQDRKSFGAGSKDHTWSATGVWFALQTGMLVKVTTRSQSKEQM